MSLSKPERRQRIRFRIRKSIGTATNQDCLYLEVTKKFMLNLIVNGVTMLAASSREKEIGKGTNVDVALAVGKLVAEKALKAGIEVVTFDRGGYLYRSY
jgi:large subunit ribosomal protein L18